MASNYSAEYGAATGAVTIVQSKSGTNEFHGSAYEFHRNDKLDANTFFNNRAGVPRSRFLRNEYGGTFGGPIQRDKTFFFGDYQGIRFSEPFENTSTIPTLAQRAMVKTGDFSGLGVPIYDPLALVPGPNNTMVRAQFPGNRIPANRLDPVAARIMDLLPDPTSGGNTRNFLFAPSSRQRTNQFDARLDQNVGAADRLFFKYSYDNSTNDRPGTLPPASNSNVPIGPYLSGGTNNVLINQTVTLNYNKVFSPYLINETRVGAVRWTSDFFPTLLKFKTSDALGIPGININDRSGGLPDLNVAGFRGLGAQAQNPELARTLSYQYEDILTLVRKYLASDQN